MGKFSHSFFQQITLKENNLAFEYIGAFIKIFLIEIIQDYF